jgi:hypothetical protein
MDKKEALKIVQEDVVGGLKNLPDEFKKDKDIVLAAVKGYGVPEGPEVHTSHIKGRRDIPFATTGSLKGAKTAL